MSYNPQQKYNALLGFIRQGFPAFEDMARELAMKYNINTKDLPRAVATGEMRLLAYYASAIAEGRKHVRDYAEPLAKKFGVKLDEMVEDLILSSAPV